MRMLGPDCRHARSQNSYGILRYANTHPPNKTLSSLIQEEPGFSHLQLRIFIYKIFFSKLCRMLFLPPITMTTHRLNESVSYIIKVEKAAYGVGLTQALSSLAFSRLDSPALIDFQMLWKSEMTRCYSDSRVYPRGNLNSICPGNSAGRSRNSIKLSSWKFNCDPGREQSRTSVK